MNNVVNQVAYLRSSREFPPEIDQLSIQVNKSYVDIANAVNSRIIGIFTANRPALTGESWFLTGNQRQQTFRQVYTISSFAAFNHGINFSSVSTFTKITGIGYNGTNYYPIPFTNPITTTGQISIAVTPTQVIFSTGVGSPSIVSGFVLLEWMSLI